MKIIIEPDVKGEKGEKRVFTNVFEFAIVGTFVDKGIRRCSFSDCYIEDRFVLIGKLEEIKERIRSYNDNSNKR